MKQPSRLGAVALALVVMIAAFALALPVTAQESNATEIDSCTTITEPGTYVLTDDITDSEEDICIQILTDRATFDGAGHTIDGVGTGVGIYAGEVSSLDARNTIVTDVTITGWGNGIVYEAVSGGAIRDSVIESRYSGIQLGFFTEDVEVTNNTIVGSRTGITSVFATDNVFENNTVSDSERADYSSDGDRDEEGESTATVRDLRLDTSTLSFEEDIQFGALRLDDRVRPI